MINKILCFFGKHKPIKTTRQVLTGNLKVIEVPTTRCKNCNCFINREEDIVSGILAAQSQYVEPDIKTVN